MFTLLLAPALLFSPTPPDPPWTLEAAIARGLEQAPEVALQHERLIEAEITYRKAWALLIPSWTAAFNFTHREPAPPPSSFPSLPDFSRPEVQTGCEDPVSEACIRAVLEEIQRSGQAPGLDLDLVRQDTVLFSSQIQWSILNGRALPQLRMADRGIELEEARRRVVERAVRLRVVSAFYAALAADRAIGTAVRARDRAARRLEIERQREREGQGAPSSLRTALIHAELAELDVGRAELADRAARRVLGALLRTDTLPAVVAPAPPSLPAGGEPEWRAAAAARRAELEVARIGQSVAELGLDDVFWRYFPVGSLFVSYRRSNVRGLSGQTDEWTFGVNAQWTLFDGGLRYQERREAESKLRSSSLAVAREARAVEDEIASLALKAEQARLDRTRAERAIDLAKEALSLAEAQLESGLGRDLEVSEAIDRVKDAELQAIAAGLDQDLAILRLEAALGP